MADKSAKKKSKRGPGGSTPAAARSKVTPELYEEILLWYVENGVAHMKASKIFKLSRRTLSGLFYEGAKHLNKPPMRLLLDNVEVRARAARAAMKKEELARANQRIQEIIDGTAAGDTLSRAVDDSVRARAEEGAVVTAGRRNILQLQSMLAPLLTGAVDRMMELQKDIKTLAPDDLVKMMKDMAKLQMDLITAAKNNMDMERLLMGDPNAREDHKPTQLGVKDAMKVLDLASRTMARMRSEGALVDAEGEETESTTLDLTKLDDEADDEDDDLIPGADDAVDDDEGHLAADAP